MRQINYITDCYQEHLRRNLFLEVSAYALNQLQNVLVNIVLKQNLEYGVNEH